VLNTSDDIKKVAKKIRKARSVLFIGRYVNFPTALEGALKLKEISYIHAEGYAAGEMKHGPIALLDSNVPVVGVMTEGRVREKILSNLAESKAREAPVIIAGFGRFGQIVARVLQAKGLPFTALDNSQTHVDFLRRFGNEVYYGDASRLDLLRAAGAQSAKALVLALDDVDASLRTATVVREQFPQLRIFARARSRQHAFALMDIGITDIIRETYASSLEMATLVLEALGETPVSSREAVRRFRDHDQKTLLAQYQVREDEEKFLATTRAAAQQLERLFEADEASTEATRRHG